MEFNHIAAHDGSDNESEGNEENAASPDPPIWFEVHVLIDFTSIYFYILLLVC